MKVFRNRNNGHLLFVDDGKWKSEIFTSWSAFQMGSIIDHIVTGRQQGWGKIGVKIYYEKILF